MTIKGIFFDLDNTLWDFSSSAAKALNSVYQKYLSERGVDQDLWQSSYKKHNEALWQSYRDGREVADRVKHLRFIYSFSDMGVTVEEAHVREISEFYLKAIVDKTVLFPGTQEVLSILKEHYILGVITNGFAASSLRLEKLGLGGIFTFLITSEQVGRPKPDKQIFGQAVLIAGLEPQEVVYVGDDYESDVVGAKSAGLGAVLFNHKNLDIPAMDVRPDYVICKLSSLIDIYVPGQNKTNRRLC